MARGVNKVILIGNLGADPEVRYTASGTAVANISLATSYSVKNSETGEWQDATEWHRVVFFERMAEVVEQYLRKGSQIYVEGNIRTEKWTDKEGQDRYTTKIYARDMQMLGGRGDSDSPQPVAPSSSQYGGSSRRSTPPPAPTSSPPSPPDNISEENQSPPPRSKKPSLPDDFEDDIPF